MGFHRGKNSLLHGNALVIGIVERLKLLTKYEVRREIGYICLLHQLNLIEENTALEGINTGLMIRNYGDKFSLGLAQSHQVRSIGPPPQRRG